MMCERPKVQLYLYLDGELAPSEAAEVEQHLQACEDCQGEATAHHRLQVLLHTALPPDDAAAERLWTAIEAQLPQHGPEASTPQRRRPGRAYVWSGMAAAAAMMLLGIAVHLWLHAPVPDVVREIVDSQIRGRLMQAPYEKVEAKAGIIRRWFEGQVEFAPPLPAMVQAPYRLQGVRVNYFLSRRVAEIAYASEQHALSFLMFADKNISLTAMRPVRMGQRLFHVYSYKGYNTVVWQDGEIFCSLVSDLQLSSLLEIAHAATS
jgi:anti-sigma factor RsiW